MLRQWRRQAADFVIAAGVVLHLPVVALYLGGFGPTRGWPARITVLLGYGASVAFALLRRIDHEIRTWVLLGFLYVVAIVGSGSVPEGPYVRALPIVAPLLAIGLIGVRSARIAAGISAGVLMFAPMLHWAPSVARVLGESPHPSPAPLGTIALQGAALTAEMLILMTLLERFYAFLLQSLAAERRAAAERTATNLALQGEIEKRRRLERETARVGDEERRRVGSELHDGVCQQLTGALLRCQALELGLERGRPPSSADLGALSSLLGETIQEAHAVAQGLCPLKPLPGALASALRELATRTQGLSGVSCRFDESGDVRVPNPTAAHHLYRIAQEAVSNAVRHARANGIAIELRGGDDALRLRVQDDGVGLPGAERSGGMGLRTMTFRAQALEGDLVVEPAADGGTRVSCRVPRASCLPPDDHRPGTPGETPT